MIYSINWSTKTQRLVKHYLKKSLIGETEKFIRHIPVTNENNSTAWSLLQGRYNNMRLLVTNQLQQTFGIPKQKLENSKGVKHVYDKIRERLLSLNNLNVNTTAWDPIVIFIILVKLDSETQKQYELSLKSSKEIQKLEEFYVFLESRFQALDVLESAQRNTKNIDQIPEASDQKYKSETNKICTICTGAHSVYDCKQILGIDTYNSTIRIINEQKTVLKMFWYTPYTKMLQKNYMQKVQ